MHLNDHSFPTLRRQGILFMWHLGSYFILQKMVFDGFENLSNKLYDSDFQENGAFVNPKN